MEINYEIVDIDFYNDLRKPQQFVLAKKYNLLDTDNIDQVGSRYLRQILAITKLAHRQAKQCPAAEAALKSVLNKQRLSSSEKARFPDIQKFAEINPEIYVTPEFDESNPTYLNVEPTERPPTPDPFITNRPKVEHLYEQVVYDQQNVNNSLPPTPLTQNTQTNNSSGDTNLTNNMAELRPLVKCHSFTGLPSEDVHIFLEKFELAAKINAWKEETKLNLFETHLSDLPYKWLQIYKNDHPNDLDWQTLKADFVKTFGSVAQIDDAETLLQNRLQQDKESLTTFLFEITYLCSKVDRNMAESKIVDYVINGCSPKYCKELIKLDNSTLLKLKQNVEKLEGQMYKEQKNARRHNVTFTPKPTEPTIIKHPTEPTLEYDNRLTQLEEIVANINMRSRNRDESPQEDKKRRPRSVEDDGRKSRDHSPFRRPFDSSTNDKRQDYRPNDKRRFHSPKRHDNETDYRHEDRRQHKYSDHRRQDGSNNRQNDYSRNYYKRPDERPTWHKTRENTRSFERQPGHRGERKYCAICKMSNHDTQECSFNAKNGKRRPPKTTCEICARTNHSTDNCFYNLKSKNV